jgi:alkylation response protein AidB-like acyl-CoA dehydrogenase
VPAKNILGGEGQGIDIALGLLDLSRFSIATSCLGLAQRLLELSVSYTHKRVTFGKRIAERQAVQQMLADMATDVYALRVMVNDVAQKYDQGLPIRKESSMCKLFGIETLRRVGDSALSIHGGLGYFKTFPIERMYRDSRALWFEEGTPTIQRLVIARDVLKEYGE